MGWEGVVDISALYELNSPRDRIPLGTRFLHLFRPALGHNQPAVQRVPGLFPGVKLPRRGFNHPPPFSADVKERVCLYVCPPSFLGLHGLLQGELSLLARAHSVHI